MSVCLSTGLSSICAIEEGEETRSQYFHTEICMYSFQVGGYGVRLKLFMAWHGRPSGGKTAEFEI